nr:hypothetical protein [Tanacetum cinerariifolium]
MGYEKPSTKLAFYKAFFSSQWMFLIHTILQCMSAKRTSWNEFSSSMALAVICLSTGMIVAQQVDDIADEGAASVAIDDVPAATDEPSIPSPTPTTLPLPPSQDLPSTSQVQPTPPPSPLAQPPSPQQQPQSLQDGRIIANMDADEDVTLKDVANIAKEVAVDAEIEEKSAELQKVVEVVTTAKLMTEVVTAASATITAAALTLTTASSAARRRKGVVIRNPEETATPSIIIHSESKSKDKGKMILVEEPKPLKKQAQEKEDNVVMRYEALKRKPQTKAQARKNMMIYLRNMAGFKMDYFKRMSYDDIRLIFEKYFNSNVAFLENTKEQMEEEDSRALKRVIES